LPLAPAVPQKTASSFDSSSIDDPKLPPTPPKHAKQFPVSVKKGKLRYDDGDETRLTRPIECPEFKTVMNGVFRKKPIQRPAMKKRKDWRGDKIMVPNGILAHLTREFGGNVNDDHVVDVKSGSFEKETQSASNIAKNAADLEYGSVFLSAYRSHEEDIRHTRNSWVCEADRLELDRREKYDLLKTRT
jgi:hypothetical protein